MKDKVIGPGKPKGVNKSPWEHKIRKGRGYLRGNGTRARKQRNKKPNDHTESLREEYAADPKKPSKLGSNNITAGMAEWCSRKCKDCRKEQKNGLKEEKPTIK